MIDRDLITRKVVLIGPDLEKIVDYAQTTAEQFLADDLGKVLCERYLERIITRMIDINYHLLVESGQAPPPDYYQSFTRLAELEVLSPEFATKIAAAAGLRSRLVHEYDTIDHAILHQAVRAAAIDFPEYLRQVQRYLDSIE